MPTDLLVECCRQLKRRDDNGGSWPDGTRPACFAEYQKAFLPSLGGLMWFNIVEAHIQKTAVAMIACSEIDRMKERIAELEKRTQ